MPDGDVAQKLLALFTSADCAEAIVGDLIEERRDRGAIWFWRHVLTTVVKLSRSTVTEAPLPVFALGAAGCALFAMPAFAGVAAVSVFPLHFGSLVSSILLSLFWWSGALWTGASLVTIAPNRGMATCLMLAVAGEALLMTFGLMAVSQQAVSLYSGYYTIAVFAGVPLLTGAAAAHRRALNAR
jgi:hypothetical protein